MDPSYLGPHGHMRPKGAAPPTNQDTKYLLATKSRPGLGFVQNQFGHTLPSPYVMRTPEMSQSQAISYLPRPNFVLKPIHNDNICEVCNRAGCNLISHKRFADEARARSRQSRELTPQTSPISGFYPALPPPASFVQYPLTMDAERHHLLSLWYKDWGQANHPPERHLFPIKWIDTILPTALKHPALFQTLLATSASMWATANNRGSEVAQQHLQIATQMLGRNGDLNPNSDENIFASLCIALIHLTEGDGFETERRFSQIVRAVSERGGPHYLGLTGRVAELLIHIDATQALFFNRGPIFAMPLPALAMGVTPRLGNSFQVSKMSDEIDLSLLQAADSLCRTADIFELALTTKVVASGAMNSFGYLSNISEYQLARCNTAFSGSNTWNESLCLALSLFNNVMLHSRGAIDATTSRIEERYWAVLRATLAQHGFGRMPRTMILWILMTGLTTCVHSNSRYRGEAIEKLRTARIGIEIKDWADFRNKVLDQHVWLKAVEDEIFHIAWLEVEEKTSPQYTPP